MHRVNVKTMRAAPTKPHVKVFKQTISVAKSKKTGCEKKKINYAPFAYI